MTGTILLILGLFVVGLVLVALEALVIPGFGVPGVLGGLLVLYAAIRGWGDLGPAWGMTIAMVAMIISGAFFFWMPNSRVGRRMTLNARIDGVATYDADARRAGVTVGQRGITASPLRPSGFAWFGDQRVEVRTDGDWLDRDSPIAVVSIKDGKVFVEGVAAVEPIAAAEKEAQ